MGIKSIDVNSMDASNVFAKLFLETKYEDLPENVVSEVKKQILDYIGVAVAGAAKPGSEQVRELYESFGGAEQAAVWGSGKKLPLPFAAQCNATAGHCLDFDDVHEDAVMHPGVVSIPTAFAVADYLGGMTGKELITAVALAGDMICRMGTSLHPGRNVIPYGWHYTTLNGSMVSALLAARLLGLDFDKAVAAMGLGYHQTAGNGQTVKDGGLAKRLGPGLSVRNGITAAMLAQRGVTAAKRIMEGEWGFYKVYHGDDFDRAKLLDGLGEKWESERVSIKPYPCCRGIHHFIDCALKLREDYKIDPDEIEKIDIECGEGALGLLCTPLEVKANPADIVVSQFSVPWGVACGLALGRATLREYTDSEEGIRNPAILKVSNKIASVEHTPEMDIGDFERAKVTVTMKSGDVYSVMLTHPKGTPEDPLSFDDVVQKFRGCLDSADRPIPAENGEKILALVRDIEALDDIRELERLIIWA